MKLGVEGFPWGDMARLWSKGLFTKDSWTYASEKNNLEDSLLVFKTEDYIGSGIGSVPRSILLFGPEYRICLSPVGISYKFIAFRLFVSVKIASIKTKIHLRLYNMSAIEPDQVAIIGGGLAVCPILKFVRYPELRLLTIHRV